jgi:hypothetical protein
MERFEMSKRTGVSFGVLLLALLCAASFGAIVRVAFAGDFVHTTCVSHGFVSGSSATDGSFFSRINAGCSSSYRRCGLLSYGSEVAYLEVFDDSTTCNAWSNTYGSINECTAGAYLVDPGVFSDHGHNASAAGC